MKNNFLNVIGLMSGTSMDGIDISHVNTNGIDLNNIKNSFYEFSKSEKKKLNEILIHQNKVIKNNKLFEVSNKFVTDLHIKSLKKINNISNIDLIGFHGQTIHHDPLNKISIQLGDPYLLSKTLKKNVVHSFRSLDIQSGGEGAPIVPIYHKLLIEKFGFKLPSCFINIGGILNLTYWDGQNLIGFDLGPGNCLMDDFIKSVSNKSFDNNGLIASKGEIDNEFVQDVLNDKFFKKKPPKSLDRSYFNSYLVDILSKNYKKEDAMATLSKITQKSITNSLKYLPKKIKSLYLCGGGSKNKFLVSEIQKKLGNIIITDKIFGVEPNFIESEMIAYLAARSFYNYPITFPKTTGVKVPLSGGEIVIYNYKKPI